MSTESMYVLMNKEQYGNYHQLVFYEHCDFRDPCTAEFIKYRR